MIHWVPVNSLYFWSTSLGSVLSQNVSLKVVATNVVLNSSSSYNYLPTADYNAVMKVIEKGQLCQKNALGITTCLC
jgi:hypothetical protein